MSFYLLFILALLIIFWAIRSLLGPFLKLLFIAILGLLLLYYLKVIP